MKRLENKSVIITAAGQGIGKETAIRFLKKEPTLLQQTLIELIN